MTRSKFWLFTVIGLVFLVLFTSASAKITPWRWAPEDLLILIPIVYCLAISIAAGGAVTFFSRFFAGYLQGIVLLLWWIDNRFFLQSFPQIIYQICGIVFGYSLAFTIMTHLGSRVFVKKIAPKTCLECGYNLCGLVVARCPECGTEFDPKILERNKTDS